MGVKTKRTENVGGEVWVEGLENRRESTFLYSFGFLSHVIFHILKKQA